MPKVYCTLFLLEVITSKQSKRTESPGSDPGGEIGNEAQCELESVPAALIGEALLFHSLSLALYAALVFVFFHLWVVLVEEPLLREKFGASYQDYCAQVPRWIPHLPIWQRKRSSVN